MKSSMNFRYVADICILHPDQFGKHIGNLEPNIKIRFYCRQAVQSKSDLIVWADVTTKKFEPQLQDDN